MCTQYLIQANGWVKSNSRVIYFSYQNVGFSRIPIRFFLNLYLWKYIIAQSICTHYTCFENMGRFVTLKKNGERKWDTIENATLSFCKSKMTWPFNIWYLFGQLCTSEDIFSPFNKPTFESTLQKYCHSAKVKWLKSNYLHIKMNILRLFS